MSKIQPVIMSGGSGTRLWPVSRAHYPKQLLPLISSHSMFQETVLRVSDSDRCLPPIVICNNDHRFAIAEQLHDIGVVPAIQVLEPVGRNTAPAAAIAALVAQREISEAPLLILPADHYIRDGEAFMLALEQGAQQAEEGHLITFGIQPDSPETGYGYIRQGEKLGKGSVYRVAQFTEKPDLETAQSYLAQGGYHWNSGMFMFTPDRLLQEMKRTCPDIVKMCVAALDQSNQDLDFLRLDETAFAQVRSDSIDYAVMENTKSAVVIPVDIGWSDIGSWSSLWAVSEKDDRGNFTSGDVISHETSDSFIRSESRLVATLGVQNLVIIESADVVMVADKNRTEDVKNLVQHLHAAERDEHISHKRVHRPWGFYEGIQDGERHQVKHLCVKPGAKLSLQKHFKRAEHWVVVKGLARVTINEEVRVLRENESAYIPVEAVHRLENIGKEPLSIIEVQSGSYLGEDDIVRYEDDYKRDLDAK